MKTTIEVPDALAARAKAQALEDGTTLRELVVEGLQREIARRETRVRPDFVFPAVTGHGLWAEVSPGDAIAVSYEVEPTGSGAS